MDYVYKNKAQGLGFLGLLGVGKLIDKGYLESVGWKGIRIRKTHLETVINTCIQELQKKGMPVRLVDIASGHGRYILDAIVPQYNQIEQVLLRDYSPINVEAGNQMILDRKLATKVKFEEGDAFDQNSLAQLSPAPTLGVVSGLYELFSDNALLQSSLSGLAQAIPKGGYLLKFPTPRKPCKI